MNNRCARLAASEERDEGMGVRGGESTAPGDGRAFGAGPRVDASATAWRLREHKHG